LRTGRGGELIKRTGRGEELIERTCRGGIELNERTGLNCLDNGQGF